MIHLVVETHEHRQMWTKTVSPSFALWWLEKIAQFPKLITLFHMNLTPLKHNYIFLLIYV